MQEIWVVSATAGLRRSTTMLLEREGYSVKAFERAAEVLSGAVLRKPAALVVDEGLPDASGFELVAALRSIPGFGPTPCLLFTQDATIPKLAFRERAMRAGCIPLDRFPPEGDEVLSMLAYSLAELPAEGNRVTLRMTENAPDVCCVAADVLDDRTVLLLLANPLESFKGAFRPQSSLRFRYATPDGISYEWIARLRACDRDWAEVEVVELASRRTAAR